MTGNTGILQETGNTGISHYLEPEIHNFYTSMIQKFIVSHNNYKCRIFNKSYDTKVITRSPPTLGFAMMVRKSGEDEIMDPSSSSALGTVCSPLLSSTSWCPAKPLGFLRSPS